MGGFMRTLAKVGLVELDEDEARAAQAAASAGLSDEEARRIIAEAGSDEPDRTEPVPPAEPRSLVELPAATTVEEGQPFDALYQQANVKPSPFSAEKLLRLLEGLMVMDPASRKTAIKAMDSADDSWTIEDPIIDAERKVGVLEAGKRRLEQQVAEAAASAKAELEAQAEYQTSATDEIKKQIAELENLLARELEKVAHERAKAETQLEATRAAATREAARLDAEIHRLDEITKMFSPAVTNTGVTE